MRHAAVKPESEVIADPRGTAVNTNLPLQSPSAACAPGAGGENQTEPNPLDVVSTRIQGDRRWRARERSSGTLGTKDLYASIAGWRSGR